ncbi:hypothetical protein ACS0TY_018978 [Phlomoides rotata]
MISSSCFLYALRRLKFISFSTDEPTALPDNSKTLVSIKALISTSPLSLTYLIYMVASMESVWGVNVPMYTTLRRTIVVFTMIIEYFMVGQRYSTHVLGSDIPHNHSSHSCCLLLPSLNSFGLMWCNGEFFSIS